MIDIEGFRNGRATLRRTGVSLHEVISGLHSLYPEGTVGTRAVTPSATTLRFECLSRSGDVLFYCFFRGPSTEILQLKAFVPNNRSGCQESSIFFR